MRHKKSGKKLSRPTKQRQALLKNLARAFFVFQGIKTTYAKAKAVQPLIERIITKAKKGGLSERRWLFAYFQDQHFVNQLVKRWGVKFSRRQGGYTRIIKLKKRAGDDALIVKLVPVGEELKKDEDINVTQREDKTRMASD